MKKEALTILNNKGQKLSVYLFKNTSDKLVLLVPGLVPYDDILGMDSAFKKYYSLGNSVCYFDKTGFGKSEGEKVIDLEQTVEDIGSILHVLSKKYKRIILYGPSLGAIPAMISAVRYRDENIIKLININGLFYSSKYLTFLQKARIILYFIMHPKSFGQLEFITKNLHPEQVKIPTLIVYGEKDPIINPDQSRQVYNRLQTKKELLVIPNGEHLLLRDEYISHSQRLFDWLS